jgi:hypothetical protein
MMMGLDVEVEIVVWTCSTLCVPESHQVSCKYLYSRKGEVFFNFGFHGELNGMVDAV